MKSLPMLLGAIALLFVTSCSKDEEDPGFGENLLVNPGAETGDLSGWTINKNGGDGWAIDKSVNSYSGDYEFATSYLECKRSQTIDLIAAGYTATQLDAAPDVKVSEWFKQIFDADEYFMKVELLDADKNVIDSWDMSGTTTDKDVWFNLSYTFTKYGTGLRYIYFEDGGKDTEYWKNHYGVRMDDAEVRIRK